MKQYPSIGKDVVNTYIYAFGKLDGNNIRAEWSKKRGFHKFGSRRQLIDASDEMLGDAPANIQAKYAQDLDRVFRANGWSRATAFFEYHGPSSFCGVHDPAEEKTVTLLDVSVDTKGILPPKDFLNIFSGVDHAPLLYQGLPTSEFLCSVVGGTLTDMPLEGVVCKGALVSPGLPLMFKVKSAAWLARLRESCTLAEFDRLQ